MSAFASPNLTGTPTAPTAAAGTKTTQIATTAFVNTAVSALKNTLIQKDIGKVNSSSGTDVTIGNSGALAAGTYIIAYHAWWNANSSGRRSFYLATSSSGGEWNSSRITAAPSDGAGLVQHGVIMATFTSTTTLYLRLYQNSGGTLGCGGSFDIMKLH